ncbi:hypothetical protein SAMN04488023_11023 [Pedobacter rhizosphaerae]|uniref:Uncharacterized protein n=1 Tax=Pedobacter rhizosphaerae TaxID=390241 RepID=A0A1H9PLP3_9SPHI|nr:hypothetical protein SAMN04488023_11023 [Pedobacter rhizosphaerae]
MKRSTGFPIAILIAIEKSKENDSESAIKNTLIYIG